jgi:hypothetical protein
MFDVGKWKAKIFHLLEMYEDLSAVLNDETAKSILVERYGVKKLLESGDYSGLGDEIKEKIIKGSLDSIEQQFSFSLESGASYLSRQIVVTLPSYLEAMSEEFLELLFAKYPDRANRYLAVADSGEKGFVELNLIARAESLEQLRIQIARHATSKAIRGAKKDLFRKMESAANGQINEGIKSKVLDILRTRNSIVHDAHEPELSDEQVREYCMTVFEFVEELGELAKANEIEMVDPSCAEPS